MNAVIEDPNAVAIAREKGNWYSDRRNNPWNSTDPSGLDAGITNWENDKTYSDGIDRDGYGDRQAERRVREAAVDNANEAAAQASGLTTAGQKLQSLATGAAFVAGTAAVSAAATSGVDALLTSIAANTPTIVLGKYSEGTMGGYTKLADYLEAGRFSLPSRVYNILDKLKLAETINDVWLKANIALDAKIVLNSDPTSPLISGAFAREVGILENAGYTFVSSSISGVNCWEAIKP
jgi:hypothetical protein